MLIEMVMTRVMMIWVCLASTRHTERPAQMSRATKCEPLSICRGWVTTYSMKLQLECAKVFVCCNNEEDVVWWEEENLMVDRPTQLICILDFYLSTYKYNRHSRAIW